MTGALLRDKSKSYDFGADVEGMLADRPVSLLDDLFSSGTTALAASRVLQQHRYTVTDPSSASAQALRRSALRESATPAWTWTPRSSGPRELH
jgi:hypothetical protein